MKRLAAIGVIAGPAIGAAMAAALAHSGADGIVGERMSGMLAMSEQIKTLNPMLSGERDLDPSAALTAARTIGQYAGETMTVLFPEGSIEGPSEARPEIWEDWPRFEELATELYALAEELEVSLAAPQPAVSEQQASPALDEWDALDTEVLLGLKSRDEHERERAAADAGNDAGEFRDPVDVYSDLAATCSACHRRFRE